MSKHTEISDIELENSFYYWLDHYTKYGDKHYSDTPNWKIQELYYDLIIDRVLNGLPEISDEENEIFIQRINKIV